jgi:hypothetical protein
LMGRLLAGCVGKVAIGGKPPPTLAQRCSYIVCLTRDQCGRGLAPDEAGTDAAETSLDVEVPCFEAVV